MKFILTLTLTIITLFVNAQNFNDYEKLEKLGNDESIPNTKSVIYGNFRQRLGFSSGGFIQEIRIENTETHELFSFIVKPAFKSAKENTFCYILKPGTYSILNYYWVKSQWYGSKTFIEPIYKDIDATDDFNKKLKSGEIKETDLIPYVFTVKANSLNYLGTWNFDNGLVKFENDKETLDKEINKKYIKLNLLEAEIVIPD